MISPVIYRIGCSICGGISILPLDVIQTKTLSTNNVEFKLEETKWLMLLPIVFAIQNTVYDNTNFINNKSIRGMLAGLSSSPLFIISEIKKLECRMGVLPKFKNFIFWITIRQLLVYLILYNLIIKNVAISNFYAALLANLIGFPFKLMSMKTSYNNIKINLNETRILFNKDIDIDKQISRINFLTTKRLKDSLNIDNISDFEYINLSFSNQTVIKLKEAK